jgi:hypothetical protein
MCTNIYYSSMCIFQEISFSCVLYIDVSFPRFGVCILHKGLTAVVGVHIYYVSVCCRVYFFLYMKICFFSSFLEYVSIYICMEKDIFL